SECRNAFAALNESAREINECERGWFRNDRLRRRAQREPIHPGIFAAAACLVIRLAHADARKAERFVETNRGGIRRTHFEEDIAHVRGTRALEEKIHQATTDAGAAQVAADADVQDVRFARAVRHDAVAGDLAGEFDHATEIADADAVAEHALAP